jgi:hypothetical protein
MELAMARGRKLSRKSDVTCHCKDGNTNRSSLLAWLDWRVDQPDDYLAAIGTDFRLKENGGEAFSIPGPSRVGRSTAKL